MRVHALDTSGGMTTEMIVAALALIKKTAAPDDYVLGFDTQVFTPTRVKDIDSFRPMGGGGTEGQTVINWAAAHGATAVTFYTDGLFHERTLDWKGITQRKCVISGGVKNMSATMQSALINDLGFQIVQ